MNARLSEIQLTPYRMKLRTMLNNRRWIAEHIDMLMEKYQSMWIVVADSTVIAASETAEAAIAACDREIDEVESVVILVPDLIPRPI